MKSTKEKELHDHLDSFCGAESNTFNRGEFSTMPDDDFRESIKGSIAAEKEARRAVLELLKNQLEIIEIQKEAINKKDKIIELLEEKIERLGGTNV